MAAKSLRRIGLTCGAPLFELTIHNLWDVNKVHQIRLTLPIWAWRHVEGWYVSVMGKLYTWDSSGPANKN